MVVEKLCETEHCVLHRLHLPENTNPPRCLRRSVKSPTQEMHEQYEYIPLHLLLRPIDRVGHGLSYNTS